MKKIPALILSLFMCLSLSACGGGEVPEAPEARPDLSPAEPDAPDNDKPLTPETDWNDLADSYTVALSGTAESGEVFVLVATEDLSSAALAVANTYTLESLSFVGDMTISELENDTLSFFISDRESGRELSFTGQYSGSDAIVLDLGDYGSAELSTCQPKEAFDLLNLVGVSSAKPA